MLVHLQPFDVRGIDSTKCVRPWWDYTVCTLGGLRGPKLWCIAGTNIDCSTMNLSLHAAMVPLVVGGNCRQGARESGH